MAGADTVLKVSCGGHIHRILLEAEPKFAAVDAAVRQVWASAAPGTATFTGAAGDTRALTEDTFKEFLATTYAGPAGRPTLKLELQLSGKAPQAAVVTVSRGAAPLAKHARSGDLGVTSQRQSAAQTAHSTKRATPYWQSAQPAWQPGATAEGAVAAGKRSKDKVAKAAVELCPTRSPSGSSGDKDEVSTEEEREVRDKSEGEDQDSEDWEEAAWEKQERVELVAEPDEQELGRPCEEGDPDAEFEEQAPMTLWPATPENTPPSSPRFRHAQLQPVFWIPVPVWLPVAQ